MKQSILMIDWDVWEIGFVEEKKSITNLGH